MHQYLEEFHPMVHLTHYLFNPTQIQLSSTHCKSQLFDNHILHSTQNSVMTFALVNDCRSSVLIATWFEWQSSWGRPINIFFARRHSFYSFGAVTLKKEGGGEVFVWNMQPGYGTATIPEIQRQVDQRPHICRVRLKTIELLACMGQLAVAARNTWGNNAIVW